MYEVRLFTLVVYTFKRKQSSAWNTPSGWGQLGPSSVASNTFRQSAAGIGGYIFSAKNEKKEEIIFYKDYRSIERTKFSFF